MSARNIGLTIGRVLEREDPDKLGRVKLTLPEYGDRETDWTRIVFPFGGKTKEGAHGAYCVPEVGDEVIVGIRQDSRDVIALGFVYSKERKPPVTNVDERVFHTKKKNKITISDADCGEKILVETKENKVLLSAVDKKIVIECGGQSIELDGKSQQINIKATKVIVEAPTIQLKGKVDVTA